MATHLRENMSIGVVADTLDALCAALAADTETTSLLPTWTALTSQADTLALQRQQIERVQRRARAALDVRDRLWDNTVAAFGRAAHDAAGGRRDQAPYTRFFGKVTPSVVQSYGIQREIDTAHAWITELGRKPDEPLAKTFAPQLTQVTDTLQAAMTARDEAVKATGPIQTTVVLFIDDVNRELDRLEGQLKQLFPGDPARVAAYLVVTRPQRSAPVAPSETEPQPMVTVGTNGPAAAGSAHTTNPS